MVYVRKTRDEFDIEANYGQGYELETSESNRKEARAQIKTYRANGINGSDAYREASRPH